MVVKVCPDLPKSVLQLSNQGHPQWPPELDAFYVDTYVFSIFPGQLHQPFTYRLIACLGAVKNYVQKEMYVVHGEVYQNRFM